MRWYGPVIETQMASRMPLLIHICKTCGGHNRPGHCDRCYDCREVRTRNQTAAGNAVRRALKRGDLVRQPCEVCGTTHQIDAHHDDYSKPLDVRWLCRSHHRLHHAHSVAPTTAI